MHKPDSAVNFLAGPYLDRRAMLREDEGWQDAARQDPDTLYLLARGTAQLVLTEPAPRIAFVSAAHPLVHTASEHSMLLLGWSALLYVVAVVAVDGLVPGGDKLGASVVVFGPAVVGIVRP